jgi:hypothetical protein
MIDVYLAKFEELLIANPSVLQLEIVRQSISRNEPEGILNHRYRITLTNGDFIETTGRLVEQGDRIQVTRYRHHWQDASGHLLKRWDNAPHHAEISSFPDHLHDGSEQNVVAHGPISALDALENILLDRP